MQYVHENKIKKARMDIDKIILNERLLFPILTPQKNTYLKLYSFGVLKYIDKKC
jgi:hypothetical protein